MLPLFHYCLASSSYCGLKRLRPRIPRRKMQRWCWLRTASQRLAKNRMATTTTTTIQAAPCFYSYTPYLQCNIVHSLTLPRALCGPSDVQINPPELPEPLQQAAYPSITNSTTEQMKANMFTLRSKSFANRSMAWRGGRGLKRSVDGWTFRTAAQCQKI